MDLYPLYFTFILSLNETHHVRSVKQAWISQQIFVWVKRVLSGLFTRLVVFLLHTRVSGILPRFASPLHFHFWRESLAIYQGPWDLGELRGAAEVRTDRGTSPRTQITRIRIIMSGCGARLKRASIPLHSAGRKPGFWRDLCADAVWRLMRGAAVCLRT